MYKNVFHLQGNYGGLDDSAITPHSYDRRDRSLHIRNYPDNVSNNSHQFIVVIHPEFEIKPVPVIAHKIEYMFTFFFEFTVEYYETLSPNDAQNYTFYTVFQVCCSNYW